MKKKIKLFAAFLSFIMILTFSKPSYAVTEEAWQEAVTVYGAALQSNDNLRNTTHDLLGTQDNDKITYVTAADLGKYLNLQSSDNVLKSSIRITKLAKGAGDIDH